MPKILIKESDFTNPGAPADYGNFTVLITGFTGETDVVDQDDILEPDHNGVYEFYSTTTFKATVGRCGPKQSFSVSKGEASVDKTFNHYGNQMAYELLDLGYPVLYKVIDKDNLFEGFNNNTGKYLITDDAFWEGFRDRASYDFRFITHGFLNSTQGESSVEYRALKTKKENAEATLALFNPGGKIHSDAMSLKGTNKPAEPTEEGETGSTGTTTQKYTESEAFEKAYSDFVTKELGNPEFIETYKRYKEVLFSNGTLVYGTYAEIIGEKDANNNPISGLAFQINELAALMDEIMEYEFSTGDINAVNQCIAKLATYNADDKSSDLPGRGDCIALIELDENLYLKASKPEVNIIDGINMLGSSIDPAGRGPYCAMTVPSVVYKIADDDNSPFDNNKVFPGAFHYLACFMNSLKQGFREWYAAAGYTRGVSKYTVDYTTVKLGEIAINALEPRNRKSQTNNPAFACNVIANFRGNYYLWGNRTAYELGSPEGNGKNRDLIASHFLNIRQLCTTIKKQLYVACRRFTFDPNSDTLWVNFCNAIRPTLDAMKADQGIRDYRIIKVATDKKAELKARIRIIPIEAVEDFNLEVSLEDSFGETTANVVEPQ